MLLGLHSTIDRVQYSAIINGLHSIIAIMGGFYSTIDLVQYNTVVRGLNSTID